MQPATPAPKFIHIDRSQTRWGVIDVESLIGPQHPARIVWMLLGRIDLSVFENCGRSLKGQVGAPRHSPRLLISVWIYAITLGVASARAIERMMSHEPGLRWLCGDAPVNHHTLSDFRTSDKERLDTLFTEVLGAMANDNLLDLTTLMQDGTKMRALASQRSYHRRPTLEEHMAKAREVLAELEQQAESEDGQQQLRNKLRHAEQSVARMELALEQMKEREAATCASKRDELRVSETDPEARKMMHPGGGWALSYNLQMTTEAQSKVIVSVDVVQSRNDQNELVPALEQTLEQCRALAAEGVVVEMPQRIVADGGYTSRENVETAAAHDVALISPWKDDDVRGGNRSADGQFAAPKFRAVEGVNELDCPAGKRLIQIRQRKHHGLPVRVYESRAADCASCVHRERCLLTGQKTRRIERVIESAVMEQYLARLEEAETKELYKRRKAVAEFPQLHFKGRWHIRSFMLRGLQKVRKEATWIALAFNMTRWIQLRPAMLAQAA